MKEQNMKKKRNTKPRPMTETLILQTNLIWKPKNKQETEKEKTLDEKLQQVESKQVWAIENLNKTSSFNWNYMQHEYLNH